LGNPSAATTDVNQPANYLLEKKQYALSYNRDKGISNWVSWHLNNTWLGATDRQNDFRPDTNLPAGFYKIKPADYRGTGFDQGHLCPSADRSRSVEDNSATFLMSNMMPQAPSHNRITWENFERYCRKLVSKGNELYIIAGPHGSGGTGSNGGVTYSLAGGKILVPAYTWKIVVVLPDGEDDLDRINANTRIIAVQMPNTQSVNSHAWEYYRLSVDELEALTGYDFLSLLPASVQAVVEAKTDSQIIQ
jgi:endonuclease G